MKVFMYEYSIHQKSPLWGYLEGLFPTAVFIIAVKNRYTRRLIVPDGKMNRCYAPIDFCSIIFLQMNRSYAAKNII